MENQGNTTQLDVAIEVQISAGYLYLTGLASSQALQDWESRKGETTNGHISENPIAWRPLKINTLVDDVEPKQGPTWDVPPILRI